MSDSYDFRGSVEGHEVNIGNDHLHLHLDGRLRPEAPSISVDDAAGLFTSMPSDALASVAPLPSLSRNVPDRNPLFTGRENELLQIARTFKETGTTVITPAKAVAAGIGGAGKSDLAAEFAHRYGQFFAGGVFWLNFGEPESLEALIGQCWPGEDAAIETAFQNLPIAAQVKAVTGMWREPIPRLLIFDNCEDEALLSKWCPTAGACRVLATSRITKWAKRSGVAKVDIDHLPRNRSIELLCRYRDDLDAQDPALDGIAETLGDLPLALHLAGSYLDAYQDETPAGYLTRIQSPSLLSDVSLTAEHDGGTLTERDKGVAATFMTSLERLDVEKPVDNAALALLALAACFAPGEPIPSAFLREVGKGLIDGADQSEVQTRLRDGMNRLQRVGLLTQEKTDTFEMHRLIAHFVNDTVEAVPEVREVAKHFTRVHADRLNAGGMASRLLPLQPHLRHLADQGGVDAIGLYGALGNHLIMVGNLASALESYRCCLANAQGLADTDPGNAGWQRDLAVSHNKVGDVQVAQGNLAAALASYQASLTIRKRLADADPGNAEWQRDLAVSHSKIGDVQVAQGKLAEAFESYQASRAIGQSLADADPGNAGWQRDLSVFQNKIGNMQVAQGNLAEALEIYQASLAITQSLADANLGNAEWQRDLIISCRAVGEVLLKLESIADARTHFETALHQALKKFGPDDESVKSLQQLLDQISE